MFSVVVVVVVVNYGDQMRATCREGHIRSMDMNEERCMMLLCTTKAVKRQTDRNVCLGNLDFLYKSYCPKHVFVALTFSIYDRPYVPAPHGSSPVPFASFAKGEMEESLG